MILKSRKVKLNADYQLMKIFHTIFHNSYHQHPAEKIVWFIIYVMAILGMSLMILDVTLEFKNSPTVTTVETHSYPVKNINYPAIAICTNNRISRASARIFAEELMELESTNTTANLTVDELIDLLKLLGHLHDFEPAAEDQEKVDLLHEILNDGYNGYDVARIMRRLTPRCRTTLRKCFWEGKDQVCDDMFFLRKTENGYCCTFNYVRHNDGFGNYEDTGYITQEIERSANLGFEYGLSFLLNPQLDNHAYELHPIEGFKILVYNSLDFPDVSSGALQEILISPDTENFLRLDATSFYSVPDVQNYDIQKRDCLFSDEQSKIFHGRYSFSDCIVHCRTRDILALCNCIPFFHPIADDMASAKVCNFKDLPCLQKYKARWRRLKPRNENNMKPFEEVNSDGESGFLICDCFPSCQDVSYSVSGSSIPLTVTEMTWGRTTFISHNYSIVHIYFGKTGSLRLRQDVQFYWYELMSNYGGICSLFLGVSMINVIEAGYNVILSIWKSKNVHVLPTSISHENQGKDITIQNINSLDPHTLPETPKLYWDEITRSVTQTKFDPANFVSK